MPAPAPRDDEITSSSTIPDAACEPAGLPGLGDDLGQYCAPTDPAPGRLVSLAHGSRTFGPCSRGRPTPLLVAERFKQGRSCVSATPPQALRQGFLAAGNRLVAADAARNAGVHATAPGKTLAQHVAPMTSCRRRPSATRVRSVRAADRTLQRLPRLRIGPSRRHDRRVGPAPRPPQSSRRAPRSAPARRSNTCWSAGAPGPGRTGGRRADPCRPRRPDHVARASDCRRAARCRLIRRRCRRSLSERVMPEDRSYVAELYVQPGPEWPPHRRQRPGSG